MLRFAEEIVLLALNDETGKISRNVPEQSLECAIAGALLMELDFMKRIEADPQNIVLAKSDPTGDPLLDETVSLLGKVGQATPIVKVLARLMVKADEFESRLLASLIHKGILKEQNKSFLWMKGERTYPMIDGREESEVRTRIRMIILTNTLPDPRDVAIISLMEACRLYRTVFLNEELGQCRKRIAQIAKMDFIGQGIARLLQLTDSKSLEEIAAS
ncbi:GPP34 family phosphoprotein [Ruficoccus amylovorans]|uniref:GPP34 family phosphoprotein n=1 Tax=Ruficoccus amylovorans TaxID=1804625 RepID=A0A842HGU1_9BACT|nr:GPP34 family phosphoprotein [Ruficoccus amylovorans]MBC2595529.1 GPP34 family phosphoprotein [Ruficoccus amylovorans]